MQAASDSRSPHPVRMNPGRAGALASARADRWLAPRLSSRLASRRSAGGGGDGRGGDPPGDGVRGGRRASGASRPLLRARADGALRAPGNLSPSEREHHVDDLPPHRHGDRFGSEGQRPEMVASLLALEVGGLLVVAGVLRLGFASDFISRPGAGWIQDRHGAVDRSQPARQGARCGRPGRHVLPEGALGSGSSSVTSTSRHSCWRRVWSSHSS